MQWLARHSPSHLDNLESWLGSCQCPLHVVGPEATVYLVSEVEFTISVCRKVPSPSTGHEEDPSIGGPGPGQTRALEYIFMISRCIPLYPAVSRCILLFPIVSRRIPLYPAVSHCILPYTPYPSISPHIWGRIH